MKKGIVITVALLLVAVGGYFISNTYAKYVSVIEGSAETEVAKWNFTTENPMSTLTFGLDQTADPTTLVADRIAPGTSGVLEFSLTNENSEVGVDVAVTPSVSGAAVPANLKFYKTGTCEGDDTAKTKAACAGTWTLSNELTTLNGTIAAGDATGLTGYVYWQWEYETTATGYKAISAINTTSDWTAGTGDAIAADGNVTTEQYALLSATGQAKCISSEDILDNTAGIAAGNQTDDVTVALIIRGTQHVPSATAITTAWN
ncbi:MAG: hypothetical protein Q4G04_06290 [bacterium]|nr:hypothetical protein [bacterium]